MERLQDTVNEGWGSLVFLDFVRAASTIDELQRRWWDVSAAAKAVKTTAAEGPMTGVADG